MGSIIERQVSGLFSELDSCNYPSNDLRLTPQFLRCFQGSLYESQQMQWTHRESKQPAGFVTQEQVLMRTASIPGKEGSKAVSAALSSVIHPLGSCCGLRTLRCASVSSPNLCNLESALYLLSALCLAQLIRPSSSPKSSSRQLIQL